MDDPPVAGTADPAFGPVREAFIENFRPSGGDPGDLGAAVAVYCEGRPVVDLWGGWVDPRRTATWERDTLVNIYSVGKAATAVTVLSLVEGGLLDLDAPVAEHWPEFARHGKDGVTLRQALSHRAAVPSVREVLPEGSMLDWDTMAAALARTPPWWEPGIDHGYHVNTYGFLVGEVARRVVGARFGTILRERVAGPLELDLHIGLHPSEHRRVATIDAPTSVEPGAAVAFPGGGGDDLMRHHAYFNPSGLSGFGVVNTRAWREAEIPSTNGHATARAVARLYAALAAGGVLGAMRILGTTLIGEARREHARGPDRVLQRDTRFGLGFALDQPNRRIGISAESFGHYGYGGSLGFADAGAGIGFGYLINRPGDRWQAPRTTRLLAALRDCLT